MKKIFIILFLTLISCENEIKYNGSNKLVIKGSIVNENNLPLADHPITVNVIKHGSPGAIIFPGTPSQDNLIAFANTDSNGNYLVVFPEPYNYDEIIITTNHDYNIYNPFQIQSLNVSNFSNYQFNAPITKLYNKSNLCKLNIELNQQSTNVELQKIEYIGEIIDEYLFINTTPEIDYYNNFPLHQLVKKNQNIILRYTLFDYTTNTSSEIDVNISIDNSNQINYTLIY